MKTVKIETPFIKLDSLLKLADMVISGGEAKTVIQGGLVDYNGQPCLMRGKKVYPGDTVFYDGQEIKVEAK